MAIGDIHGCSTALNSLLAGVQISSQDIVVVLGDLVDRGPDSRAVLERLLQLATEVNLIAIRGNDEDMLLQSLERGTPRMMWIGAGAKATLESYGGGLEAIPHHHLDFVTSMPRYWQTDTHIFVHANIDPDVEMEDQADVWLRWHSLTGEEVRHRSGKTVICGHTGLKNGLPAYTDGFVCIDKFRCQIRYVDVLGHDVAGTVFCTANIVDWNDVYVEEICNRAGLKRDELSFLSFHRTGLHGPSSRISCPSSGFAVQSFDSLRFVAVSV